MFGRVRKISAELNSIYCRENVEQIARSCVNDHRTPNLRCYRPAYVQVYAAQVDAWFRRHPAIAYRSDDNRYFWGAPWSVTILLQKYWFFMLLPLLDKSAAYAATSRSTTQCPRRSKKSAIQGRLPFMEGRPPQFGKRARSTVSGLALELRIRVGEASLCWSDLSSTKLFQTRPWHPSVERLRQRLDESEARLIPTINRCSRLLGEKRYKFRVIQMNSVFATSTWGIYNEQDAIMAVAYGV